MYWATVETGHGMSVCSGRPDYRVHSSGTRAFIGALPCRPRGKIGNRRPGPRLLIHEPAKQSRKPAKLDLLTLEPGVQPAVGDRGRGIAAIKRVCLIDDGVVAQIALGGWLRACGLRSLRPNWIALHHSSPVSDVNFR
jgi:hypothetical protein